jgi:maltose alpha-D-glucosyltransferase/alpha-amylase
MLRSFHYAAYAALYEHEERSHARRIDRAAMVWWARGWYAYVGGAFMNGYLRAMGDSPILPQDPEELARLLDVYLLEKAIYELGYELGNRPAWAAIPMRGLLQLLDGEERAK